MLLYHRFDVFRFVANAAAAVPGRCGHPGQQHGRRFPAFRYSTAMRTCLSRVSGFLNDVTQQYHSLRASGVTFSHILVAEEDLAIAMRRSLGIR